MLSWLPLTKHVAIKYTDELQHMRRWTVRRRLLNDLYEDANRFMVIASSYGFTAACRLRWSSGFAYNASHKVNGDHNMHPGLVFIYVHGRCWYTVADSRRRP
jgi:hypothetical protein